MDELVEPEKSKNASEADAEPGTSTSSAAEAAERTDNVSSDGEDYPPTPERVPPNCVTPPPGTSTGRKKPLKKRRSKSLDGKEMSSSQEDGGRSSPEDGGCAICLGKMANRAKTDTCFHEFCFTCLIEWAKVRPVCPLCKGKFSYVMHNIRSDTDYERYDLPTVADRVEETLHGHLSDFMMYDRRFRYHTTRTNYNLNQRRDALAAQLQNLVIPAFPDRISGRSHFRRRRGPGTSDFRRDIYARDLWVEPMADITGRYRNCSPEWYRTNEAQTHRLVPFLNRELIALLEGGPHQAQQAYLTQQITEWVTRFEIQSPEMRDNLLPYLGLRTEHFQHELYNYARSTFDLIGYDRNAQYRPRRLPTAEVVSSGSDTESDGPTRTGQPAATATISAAASSSSNQQNFMPGSAFGVIQSSLEILNSDEPRSRQRSPHRSSRRRSRSPVERSRSADRRESWRHWRKRQRDQFKDRQHSRRRSRSQDRLGGASGSSGYRRQSRRELDRIMTSRRQTEFTFEWPPPSLPPREPLSRYTGAERSTSSVLDRSFDVFGMGFRDRASVPVVSDQLDSQLASTSLPRTSQVVRLVREGDTDQDPRGERNRRKNKKPSRFMRTHQDLQRNFPHLLEDTPGTSTPIDPNQTIDLVASPADLRLAPVASALDTTIDVESPVVDVNTTSGGGTEEDSARETPPLVVDTELPSQNSKDSNDNADISIDLVEVNIEESDQALDLSISKSDVDVKASTSQGLSGGPSHLVIRPSSSSSTSSAENAHHSSSSSSSSSEEDTRKEFSVAPVLGQYLSESTGLLQPNDMTDLNTSGREKNLSATSDDDSDLEVVDVVKAKPKKTKDPEIVELSDSDADTLPDVSSHSQVTAPGLPDPDEPIEISSGSEDEQDIFPGNAADRRMAQTVFDALGSAWDGWLGQDLRDHQYERQIPMDKGKGTGKKSKPPPPPPEESSSEDDLIVVKTDYNTVDPITKKEIVEPVKNKKCNHVYEKSTIYSMIDLARGNGKPVKCPYMGCNCRDFKKTDLIKDKEVFGHLQKVRQEREEENLNKAKAEAEKKRLKAEKKKSGNESDQSADSIIEDVIEMIQENKAKEKADKDESQAEENEDEVEKSGDGTDSAPDRSSPGSQSTSSVEQPEGESSQQQADVDADAPAECEDDGNPEEEEEEAAQEENKQPKKSKVAKKKKGGKKKNKEKTEASESGEDTQGKKKKEERNDETETDEESFVPLSKSKRQRKRKVPDRLNESWSGSDLDSDENIPRKRAATSGKSPKRKVPRGKTIIRKKVTESYTWFYENKKGKGKAGAANENAGADTRKSSKNKAGGSTEAARPRRKAPPMSYVESSSEEEFC